VAVIAWKLPFVSLMPKSINACTNQNTIETKLWLYMPLSTVVIC